MIIFGSRNVPLTTEVAEDVTCQSCGTRGSVTVTVFRRHAHVFWIPFFPIGKNGRSTCVHCKNVLLPREMP